MISNVSHNYAKAVEMLLAASTSLKALASLSSFEVFSFYQGADLTDLDLSGQDLTGLNFDYADLSGSRLDKISYDVGAFNRAKIDARYESLSDNYDLAFDDLLIEGVGALALVFQFRPGVLEDLMLSRGKSVRDFAAASDLAPGTFWRMRNGHSVTYGTVRKLIDFTNREEDMFLHSEKGLGLLKQPSVRATASSREAVSSARILRAAELLRVSWRVNPRPLYDEHIRRKIDVRIVEWQYLVDTGQSVNSLICSN